jgi:hypothetical protein
MGSLLGLVFYYRRKLRASKEPFSRNPQDIHKDGYYKAELDASATSSPVTNFGVYELGAEVKINEVQAIEEPVELDASTPGEQYVPGRNPLT